MNTLDSVTSEIIQALTPLKKLYLNLTAKINCFKSCALGKLYYLANLIVPTPKQVSLLNKARNWFLFSKDEVFDPSKRYSSLINGERMYLPAKKGGFNLPSHPGTLFPVQSSLLGQIPLSRPQERTMEGSSLLHCKLLL